MFATSARTRSSSSTSRIVSVPPVEAPAAIGAGLPRSVGARQINVKRRAVPDAALHFDRAVVLLDDAVDRREPEAGALCRFPSS